MQVIDLLALPEFELEVVVKGELATAIRWVHVTESRNPAQYLRGGELVLTSGAWYTGADSVASFVSGLISSNLAALGFGTHVEMPKIPKELITAARKNGFTLLKIPPDVTFISISEAFVDKSIASREQPLQVNSSRNIELISILQKSEGIEPMLELLNRYLPGSTAVISENSVLARYGGIEITTKIFDAIARSDISELISSGYSAFPIPAWPNVATLLVESYCNPLTTEQLGAIDQVLGFVGIEIQRHFTMRQSVQKFAPEIFDFLEAGPHEYSSAEARMRSIGMSPDRPLIALCIDANGSTMDVALEKIQSWLNSRTEVGLAGQRTGQIMIILPFVPGDAPDELGRALNKCLGESYFVGVGSIAADARTVRNSLIEAQHVCRYLKQKRTTAFATHDSLATHSIMLATQSDQVLASFESKLLSKVKEHDVSRHTNLLETLERFLASACQFQSTADELHVHVNTLRQRLERIEELTNRDLSTMETRVDFWLALQASNLHKNSASESV